jgi:protein TonB
MLPFQCQDIPRTAKKKPAARAVSLINLTLIEPPPPEKPPMPEPLVAVPEQPAAEAEEPAENFISLERPPEDLSPVETAASPPSPPEEPDGATGTRAYLKNNYDYIQRHIRNKLVYPPEARRSGVQGVAELSFVIHIDGQVSDVKIIVSSGSETLDASAVEAIYSAAPFRPPPNQARLIMPVAFRLR